MNESKKPKLVYSRKFEKKRKAIETDQIEYQEDKESDEQSRGNSDDEEASADLVNDENLNDPSDEDEDSEDRAFINDGESDGLPSEESDHESDDDILTD